MSPPISLPFDILEHIIDEVASQQDPYANCKSDSLRACSLVCKAFTERSRKHLFSGIEISSYHQCDRLHDILKSSPSIAFHVRHFTIDNQQKTVQELEILQLTPEEDLLPIDHPLLPSVMATLTNVAVFSLYFNSSHDWEDLSSELAAEIQTMCTLPSIRKIYLTALDDFPLTLLHGPSCVHVALQEVSWMDNVVEKPERRIGLRSMRLNCTYPTLIELFVASFQPPNCRLEKLTIDNETDLHLGMPLASAHRETLKALIINDDFYKDPAYIINFPQLEEISLRHRINTLEISDDALLGLDNIKLLSRLSRENKIKTIRIRLDAWILPDEDVHILENPPESKEFWEDLTDSRFPHLRSLNIKLGGQPTSAQYNVLEERLRTVFAVFASRGVMTVDNIVGQYI